ncbi:mitochondrial import inner membrane translocase subunit Tim29 [Epargyreus clarus]|uniref:mitochondrial import inner membrane translocase subunit Tim29 n=1 Tax=Epargyreus clarus TaxID=520877 RepID=UPI003C2EFEB8
MSVMLRTLKKTPVAVTNLKGKVKFPEKFKGTILEKWANYWKNLFIDYKQMLQDLRTDIQDDPRKAFLWTTGLATTVILAKNNPTEIDFKDSLKRVTNNVILVSEECRNPKSIEHLRAVEQYYNEGLIHYRSFGIASVMYTSECNESCDLYKAHCSYLKPTYFSFPSRVVDFGFMGRWWNVYVKTVNYDINI